MQQVAGDDEHGSAYVSVRALEVLRDRVGSFAVRDEGDDGSDWSSLTAVAERLLDARASMAAVANRVNRAMAKAAEGNTEAPAKTPEAVEQAARQGIERAVRADEAAAANVADEIRGATVLTLSRSGTVLDALPAADGVFVAESQPAREAVGVAAELAARARGDDRAPAVTLHTDAAVAHVLASEAADAVVVGADAVLADGRVVNKTGTRGAALAASREGIPLYAVAAADKIRIDDEAHLEDGDPEAVYDGEDDVKADQGETGIEVLNPTFDVTPADLVSGVITERGVRDPAQIGAVADELRELAAWRE
jgi:translation initiation factor 2B subunit (eIF-2B alpha/beta/delta family)